MRPLKLDVSLSQTERETQVSTAILVTMYECMVMYVGVVQKVCQHTEQVDTSEI